MANLYPVDALSNENKAVDNSKNNPIIAKISSLEKNNKNQ
jgi:hypothetical protein